MQLKLKVLFVIVGGFLACVFIGKQFTVKTQPTKIAQVEHNILMTNSVGQNADGSYSISFSIKPKLVDGKNDVGKQ